MSQTAGQYLSSLVSTWTPSSGYFDAHRRHKGAIEARLDSWYGLHDMFETGSLRHGTGIWHYSDADYFASMKGFRPSSDTALYNVKRALQDRYPNTTIQIRKPTVKCLFANGTEVVEVCPAYPADGGGYWIPDPRDGDWMKSHPKDHNAFVNEANLKHDGGAKKLARLAKLWKYQRSVPISSCYLEMRAAKYAVDEPGWILYVDLHEFLERLLDGGLAAMNDPTGLGSRFSPCSSATTKADALSKLDTAVSRAKAAMDYESAGNHEAAVERLKMVFND